MAKPPLRVRSALAMRLVNLDRLKFNEAVANGHYPCAPMTTAGSVRLFGEDDLVVLYIFARLLELNVLPRRAGQLACELKSELKQGTKRLVYVRGEHFDFFKPANDYDPDHEANGKFFKAGRVVLSIDFYISHIRDMLADRIENERSIMGTEGADD